MTRRDPEPVATAARCDTLLVRRAGPDATLRLSYSFSDRLDAKFGVRWTPMYIKSGAVGIWCNPFYGCWTLVDNDYSTQFETAVERQGDQ